MSNPSTWWHNLNKDTLQGKTIDRGGFKFSPAFDFDGSGKYDERFWSLFRRAIRGLPEYIPYKFDLQLSKLSPASTAIPLSKYEVRLKGLLYPHGAVSLRISEYIEPKKPMLARDLVSLVLGKLAVRGRLIERRGLLGDLKNTLIKAFVKKGKRFAHNSTYYTITHFDSTLPLDQLEWKQLAQLLAFSNNPSHAERYPSGSLQNVGIVNRNQLILAGSYATFAYTPDMWGPARRRGRGCLRNRLANVAELAMIQPQVYFAYSNQIRQLKNDLPLKKNRHLAEIGEALWPSISFQEIRYLVDLLGTHEALSGSTNRDVKGWFQWYGAFNKQFFQDRENARKIMKQLNDLSVNLNNGAEGAVKSTLDTLSKLPIPGGQKP